MTINSDIDHAKQLKYALQNDTIREYYTISFTEGIKYLIRFHDQLVIIDVSSGEADGFQNNQRRQQFCY